MDIREVADCRALSKAKRTHKELRLLWRDEVQVIKVAHRVSGAELKHKIGLTCVKKFWSLLQGE